MRLPLALPLLCASTLLCVSHLLAQAPPTFPAEPYVVTKALTSVSMNADATGTRVITFAVRVQSEAALRQFSVASISFASQAERADFVYVRVTHPDGTTQESPVADAIEQPAPVTREAPFYSDIKTKELPVKSLRIGDTLEWQARFNVVHPEVPNRIWGQDTFIRGAVSLDETYELRVPATLHITAWTNPRVKDSFSESTEGATHLYRWHHTDLKPTVGPAAEAFTKAEETRLRTPDEELDLTKGELPSLAWSSFEDWAAVGAWYGTLTADRIAPDAAIRAKVAELTAGKSTDLDRAQAVYTYVSARIRYIGVSFGIGRYQPHTAAEIFANQYGDCKDKHTLLASMLSVLNLHAEPVLIGAGIRFNPAVPSPASFNHLITRVSIDGKATFLDSTAEIAPWGALFAPTRDQQALVIPAIPAASPAVILTTPKYLPYPLASTFAVVGSLDKDLTSDSKIVLTMRGDDELVFRSVLRQVSPSDYGAFIQQAMANLGFGGTTSEPAFDFVDDTTHPLPISFHYHRLKEKDWGDNRITATFLQISLPSFTSERPPVIAIQLGNPRTETSTVEMQLPPGWTAHLPDAVHAHAPFATCDVTYRLDNGKLFAERRLVILQDKAPVADYKKYQSWYDNAGASGVPYIQLIPPIKEVTSATLPTPKAPDTREGEKTTLSDPKAAELVEKAFQSARTMDLDATRTSLDEAAKINPKEPRLWAGYAAVAELLGKRTEVLEDMQHELTYHPDEVQFYRPLVQAQIQYGDTAAAQKNLHAWIKAAPTDQLPPSMLVDLLLRNNQPAEALREARSAIATFALEAEDVSLFRIAAAKAQISLGQIKEAALSIQPVITKVTNPSALNDLNFIFAETSTNLDQAHATQQDLLATDEAETNNWSLSDSPFRFIQKQNTLAAEWDTMAWILYRQSLYAEALAYAGAALRATESPVTRTHFEAIAAAMHSPAASAKARQSDQAFRTFALGSANGRSGVASFVLLIAKGKVVASTPEHATSSSTPTIRDAADLLKAADLRALAPPASEVHLVRTGFVNCHSASCELVLAPLPKSTLLPIAVGE